MMRISHKTFVPMLLLNTILLGCRLKHSTVCSSPQVAVEDPSIIESSFKAAPLGGFIHVGTRACTSTLSLVAANDSSLIVNAYSALHCFREDKLNDEKISLSVFVEQKNQQQFGYLTNITAHDEFFDRRREFLSEIDKLKLPFVSQQIGEIMKIELPYFFEDKESVRASAGEDSSDQLFRNACLTTADDRLQLPNTTHSCWSSLDTNVRQLEIKAAEVAPKYFNQLRQALEKQNSTLQNLFRSNSVNEQTYQRWKNRIEGLTGLWRLTNYSSWVFFLNKDMCPLIPKDTPEYQMCSARDKIIELTKKYMVEFDSDGQKKSILQKADELGFGLNQNLLTENKIELVNLMPKKAFDKFHEVFAAEKEEMKRRLIVENETILPLSSDYVIAANQGRRGQNGQKESLKFSLLKGQLLAPAAPRTRSKGVSSKGTVRFYVNKNSTSATFEKTDSGAMLTYAGVIPLLILNSVDDEPTSGGASILELPELPPEAPSPGGSKSSICK